MVINSAHPKKSGLDLFTTIGGGLVLTQFLIFSFGINFFHTNYLIPSEQSQHNQHPVQDFQRRFRKISSQRPKFKSRQTSYDTTNADGTFNGYPMYYKEIQEAHTVPHCVGENYFDDTAWKQRSCRFSFFCFDTSEKEYVVFQSPDEAHLYDHLASRQFIDVSQSYLKQSKNQSNTVSLGGINLKWGPLKDGIGRLEWFPIIHTLDPSETTAYYELPPNVTMVPFHSMNGANPGHLVWDDFLPIYTLLTMFQLESTSDLMMMRYVLKGEADKDNRGLWASCDWKEEKRQDCERMHKKFLPLMMGQPPIHDSLITTESFSFLPKLPGKTNLVCARNGLAGIGSLTDHGTSKLHGWEELDYKSTHNHGRGGMLYDFRNFMVSNLGVDTYFEHKPPFRIVFSKSSSEALNRNVDFATQIDLLQNNFSPKMVSIESYVMKDLTMIEQVEMAGSTSIFISVCGGGAVTATFLPKGASVILYYSEDGGLEDNKKTEKPARLDWDLFNNFAYLKVHWLPKKTMQTEPDLQALAHLVKHELDALMRDKSYDKFFN
jgi:hypothetical protein